MVRKTLAFLAAASMSAVVCAAQDASPTPAAAAMAAASTGKVSGTLTCSRPDPMHRVDAADWPGHGAMVSRTPCSWTTAAEIAGEKTKDGYSVGAADVEKTVTTERGSHVTTMSNGDLIYVQYRGKGMLNDKGAPLSSEGTWTFKGGSGKFAGLQGMGTYRGKANPDGSMSFAIEGNWKFMQ